MWSVSSATSPSAAESIVAVALAVSVASGAPCLGEFPLHVSGPVLLFGAEGCTPVVRQLLPQESPRLRLVQYARYRPDYRSGAPPRPPVRLRPLAPWMPCAPGPSSLSPLSVSIALTGTPRPRTLSPRLACQLQSGLALPPFSSTMPEVRCRHPRTGPPRLLRASRRKDQSRLNRSDICVRVGPGASVGIATSHFLQLLLGELSYGRLLESELFLFLLVHPQIIGTA
jgi:hypothetical protein